MTTRRHISVPSKVTLSIALAILLGSSCLKGCAREPLNLVKTKVFALTPHEYFGRKVALEGQILGTGPGGAFFFLEDESGRILVSTESIPRRVACHQGQTARLIGALRSVAQPTSTSSYASALYFSMEHLVDCRP